MVGAIPFDTRKPSSLFIPQRWETFSRPARQQSARYFSGAQALKVTQRAEIPPQPVFEEMVARAASLTATPQVNKVVLSRLIDIATDKRPDSGALMERLIAQNPASFNFHVPLEDGGVLLGASPELLLRKEGAHFSSLPLAGSARRQPDDVLDREAGNKLLASEKDRHEHDLVTQAMKAILAPRSHHLSMPDSPQLITTPTLWHLATPVEGEARENENALTTGLPAAPDSGAERLPASGGERADCRTGAVRPRAVRWHRWLVRQRRQRRVGGDHPLRASSRKYRSPVCRRGHCACLLPGGRVARDGREALHHAQRFWFALRKTHDHSLYPLA